LERVKEILTNPVAAILKAKKEKNINKTMLILLLSWLLTAISFFFVTFNTMLTIVALGSFIAVFVSGILFSLFYSYIVDLVMNILGGKGKYYETLTATTYSSLPISVGLFLTSILFLINQLLGLTIGFIIISITTALTLSIYFRAIKEFYSTDMIITFIGFFLIIYIFMVAFYISIAFTMSSSIFFNILSNFRF